MRGFNLGRGRQPLTKSQEADSAVLQSVLKCILADFGLVTPPPGGCPVRTRNVQADKIGQIVFEVMQALEERGIL
jgi:4-hydroxy-tetrahydrodipicolinate synthase